MSNPDTIKQLLSMGARLKINLTAPNLLTEYIALAVAHGGHLEIKGATAPNLLVQYAKAGGSHVAFDLTDDE